MSPMTMAILALLAWKGSQAFRRQPDRGGTAARTGALTPGQVNAGMPGGSMGGGLSDLMKGGLGGLLARRRGRQHPQRRARRPPQAIPAEGAWRSVANSWVSKGHNKAMAPGDLANALGADQIEPSIRAKRIVARRIAEGLSQYLPDAINHLTPEGRLPNEDELSGRI